jgi:hypothetical protein
MHHLTQPQTLEALNARVEALTEAEATIRLATFGPNLLPEKRRS